MPNFNDLLIGTQASAFCLGDEAERMPGWAAQFSCLPLPKLTIG